MEGYQISRPEASDAASFIQGQRQAEGLISMLRLVCADGSELHRALVGIVNEGDEAKLKGFCRAIQKKLEAK